ncbi:DUF2953 domain-containing protein [Lentibacillus amyloliquefaciens]|uniref:DUF2953 domain-containing protein n=1 Tax=Lentibacillus amyloliquefaciens TaxID=1472767 RepID=A0A0U4FIC4_9BACI|nr:DUF2953 domain-containing protein [Lentibacillus amyloliquefaciens]ALX48366.1 hypothetical protein AOX59_06935 [Lentibacillus amyloliquefaciens]
MVLGLFCVFLIILIAAVLLSRIKIDCSVLFDQNQQTLDLAVYYFRIRIFKRTVDLSEETNNQDQSLDETLTLLHKMSENFIQRLKSYHDMTTIILERLRFERFSWVTEVGAGKAPITGVLTGGIWSVKGMITGLLSSKSHFDHKPLLEVIPLFNQKQIDSKVDCMITIRTGQAIYALLKFIRKDPKNQEAII